MTDAKMSTTEVVTQYSSQLTSDLERNAQEQDTIRGEIEGLQGRLLALQNDHAVLASMRQALENGIPTQHAAGSPGGRGADSGYGPLGGAVGVQRRIQNQPTLVSLIRAYLAQQSEPCSAAEVASALSEGHPDRIIKTTVVRTTLEGLVARSTAQRLKQGHSVFYTSLEGEEGPSGTVENSEETSSAGRSGSKD
ncbi:hypothetical protein [Streptomyces sp. S.PB5]|uniref:hypothetical protein n=1 Tax=Streptomyces sp. S.PB5 TaxID=3020844 RepID=UPI0025AF02D4|nr:hypothetical protein [Streptomyces sp. S.PB5]MDN3029670.1 hypothetical protein [Streptomyces sp. S.PB5]